jgi:hypothetical protein
MMMIHSLLLLRWAELARMPVILENRKSLRLQGLKASEASSRGRPNKYSVKAVRDAAIDKAKPIEDPAFLICQLQLHEHLHQKHTSGEIPKTMLSLYLECTEASRTRRLAEIIAEINQIS